MTVFSESERLNERVAPPAALPPHSAVRPSALPLNHPEWTGGYASPLRRSLERIEVPTGKAKPFRTVRRQSRDLQRIGSLESPFAWQM
jgi:hypothetical protein